MPLPSDEKLIRLGKDLLEQFDTIFGQHPGFRPAHAKGVLLTGTFTPAAEASSLTRAPHVARDATPVTARFSDGTGLPMIPDNDPNANPRGLAIRFHLADHVHTDIISHSSDGFPARNGQEFLEMLRAVAASRSAKASPSPIEMFLGTHPAALAYVQMPKPSPASFAKEAYFNITALRFINRDGVARYGRYRITPEAEVEHLDEAAAKGKDPNYLFDELNERIGRGPIRFEIHVQVANGGMWWTTPRSTGPATGGSFLSERLFSPERLPTTHSSRSGLFSTRFRGWTASNRPMTRCSNCERRFI